MSKGDPIGRTEDSFTRRVRRIMLIAASVILGLLLVLTGVLIVLSPGKPRPLVDENGSPLEGSISEKIRVEINGVQQGMFIQSLDETNPVLLFVHGGPG